MRAYERLIKYAAFPTASDENCPQCPSTHAQTAFANALADELRTIGLCDVTVDENGYLFASIDGNIDNYDGAVIGFIAHMDVVDVVPFTDIKPRLIENYRGGDILLNAEKNISLLESDCAFLGDLVGKTLLVTDGTTLLGADDKAGIAEIITMAENLVNHPEIKHGPIRIGFTPDEEIGRGADLFDVKRFGADFAYTVDGGSFGGVVYETFNAASADLTITGKSIHPGAGKNAMLNAARIAEQFDMLLPQLERPEYTEGYEGFYHLIEMKGDVSSAKLRYILRDHDWDKLTAKKEVVRKAVEEINRRYGEGTAVVEIRDSYRNMREMVEPHRHLINIAYECVRALGGTPVTVPVRGGTDGSRLSYMGLPCPNLGTGSYNHHGCFELACVEQMDDCTELIIKIAEAYGKLGKDYINK